MTKPNIQPRRPEQLRRRRTAYEVVAEINGDRTRLAFTARPTQQQLFYIGQRNLDFLRRFLTDESLSQPVKFQRYGRHWKMSFAPGASIFFTGRTELDCAWDEQSAQNVCPPIYQPPILWAVNNREESKKCQ
jgi:hypothetical protein